MPLNYHPWRNLPKNARLHIGSVKVNLTFDKVITGYGGKGRFNLHYTCRHDLCSKKCKYFLSPLLFLKFIFNSFGKFALICFVFVPYCYYNLCCFLFSLIIFHSYVLCNLFNFVFGGLL
jgi:hypothetical protein